MGRRFLRGLLLLLWPPPFGVRHCMHSLESVQPSKRPRSSPMAPPRIGTHNGTFHCDEALACALLRLLPQYRVRSAWGHPRALTRSLRYLGRPEHPSYVPRLPKKPNINPLPRDFWQPPQLRCSSAGCRNCANPGPRKTSHLRHRGRRGWRI